MPKLFGVVPVPGFGLNFTKSEHFKRTCKKAFDDVDMDHDGQLDLHELTIAVLRMFDLLNKTLPVHLRIPTRQEMQVMMAKYDKDRSGKLDFNEFLELCRGLLGAKGKFWDSLFFKASAVLVIKVVAIPLLIKGVQQALKQADVKMPTVAAPVLAFGLETAAKRHLPLPI